jgi:hypothetical protein
MRANEGGGGGSNRGTQCVGLEEGKKVARGPVVPAAGRLLWAGPK